jgi:hypothetical protein
MHEIDPAVVLLQSAEVIGRSLRMGCGGEYRPFVFQSSDSISSEGRLELLSPSRALIARNRHIAKHQASRGVAR